MVGRLADRPAANEVDDRQQDDRAEQRIEEGLDGDRRLLMLPPPKIRPAMTAPTMPTTMFSMMPCWASVRMIRLASQPHNTADDQPNDDTHERSLLFVAAIEYAAAFRHQDA